MSSKSKSENNIAPGSIVRFRLRSRQVVTGTIISVRDTTSGTVVTIRRGDFVDSVREQDIVASELRV
jgi:hypothetical protein